MNGITKAFREGFREAVSTQPRSHVEKMAANAGRFTRYAPCLPDVAANIAAQALCALCLTLQSGVNRVLKNSDTPFLPAYRFFAQAYVPTQQKAEQFFAYLGSSNPQIEASFGFYTSWLRP